MKPLHSCNRSRAFTLLELILAIIISAGLLFVALHFYRQAERLRTEIEGLSEHLTTVRLTLAQMARELQSTSPAPTSLSGQSNRIELVILAGTSQDPSGTITARPSEQRIRYTFNGALMRSELPSQAFESSTNLTDAADTLDPRLAELALEEPDPAPRQNSVIVPGIKLVQFRFWTGTNWVEEWSGAAAPRAIEIILGTEELAPDTMMDEYPGHLFQRRVVIPTTSIASTAGVSEPNLQTPANPAPAL